MPRLIEAILPLRYMENARFLYDLTVLRYGVEFSRRSGGGKGMVLTTPVLETIRLD